MIIYSILCICSFSNFRYQFSKPLLLSKADNINDSSRRDTNHQVYAKPLKLSCKVSLSNQIWQ